MGGISVRQGLFGLLMGSATRLKTLVKAPRCAFYSASSGEKPRRKKWSEEELEKIQELARKYSGILNVENLEAEFPGRTFSSICSQHATYRARLKHGKSHIHFSPEEDRLLIEAKLAGGTWAYISRSFPDRTLNSLRTRWTGQLCRGAEIASHTKWSSGETSELLRLRNELGLSWKEIAMKLGRRARHVRGYYVRLVPPEERMGMNCLSHSPRWTQEDLKALVRMKEDGKSIEEIGKVLGRSSNAVLKRYYAEKRIIRKPGTKSAPWTKNEFSRLEAAFEEGLSLDQIKSKFPDRTMLGVKRAMSMRGLSIWSRRFKWTEKEDDIITAASHLDEMVSKLPGKPLAAIESRKMYLVLQDSGRHWSSRSIWTPAEDATLEAAIQKGLECDRQVTAARRITFVLSHWSFLAAKLFKRRSGF
ncbi:hypothetical protein P171DRAFT_482679 [Karstenula rhodostoma CBS 690.94]|uniref:Myb-like domain-containing protein n=1 Tax=Karstenula rhodostoma CBS 690.94 TaxID=1392251 RepID=A0A9P4PSD8_9PLEO|nr:hypothetical protein P171DRAFT_482679 [Karstenula rhodostoma CBS 690.94]